MSKDLSNFLSDYKGKTLLAIFSHPDDESFVAGGLFQLASEYGIRTTVICLTDGTEKEKTNNSRKAEMDKACSILGIEKVVVLNFTEGLLNNSVKEWTQTLIKEVKRTNPFAVLTFDPNGITGNPDHIITSIQVLNIIKGIKKKKPHLLWRVSDLSEKNYFYKNKGLVVDKIPTFQYSLTLSKSMKKLKAIFSYKSQLRNLIFKLRILEWYLFDHRENYYLVDFKEDSFELLFKKD